MVLALAGTLHGIRLAVMKDVPSHEFNGYIYEHWQDQLVESRITSPSSMPLLMSLRFPKRSTQGGLGVPNCTYVHVFETDQGPVECRVHIRGDRVCLVAFSSDQSASEMRQELSDQFPGLTVN